MKYFISIYSGIAAVLFIVQVSFFNFNLGNYYYLILIVLFILLLILIKKIQFNFLMIWLLIAGLLSIVLNEIPIFFKPVERFVAFILVMGLVGPLIRNSALERFRFYLFNKIKALLVAFVIISFLGIAAGLPMMVGRGGFAGLFNHSMMLGPMAAISILVCLSWGHSTLNKNTRLFFLALASISFITCVAAGSRSALLAGISGILFYYYKLNQMKFSRYIRIILIITSIGILSFPIWESYTERIIEKMSYADDQGALLVTRGEMWATRIFEFQKSPIYGVGFSSIDTSLSDKFNEEEGTIEPGSSWLVVLSMTGLLGFLPLFFLIFSYLKFLFTDKLMIQNSALLGGLLVLLTIHMMAEGYVFSAGSGLFFIFWLIMGMIEQSKKPQTNIDYLVK